LREDSSPCAKKRTCLKLWPRRVARVPGIIHHCIATHRVKQAGFSCKTDRTRAATPIQRFGSAPSLNTHPHMLFLDRVYVQHTDFLATASHRQTAARSSASVLAVSDSLLYFDTWLFLRENQSYQLRQVGLDEPNGQGQKLGPMSPAIWNDSITLRHRRGTP